MTKRGFKPSKELIEKRRQGRLKSSKRLSTTQYQRHLHRKYGITEAEFDLLFEAQNGCCTICHKEETTRRLSVDHDHRTKRVRGLLCTKCNMILGLLDDNPVFAKKIAEYLEFQTGDNK